MTFGLRPRNNGATVFYGNLNHSEALIELGGAGGVGAGHKMMLDF